MSVRPAAGLILDTFQHRHSKTKRSSTITSYVHTGISQIMIRSSFNYPASSVQRDLLLAFYQAVTVTLASTAFYAGYKIAQNPQRYTFCFYSEESRKHAVAGEVKTKL